MKIKDDNMISQRKNRQLALHASVKINYNKVLTEVLKNSSNKTLL